MTRDGDTSWVAYGVPHRPRWPDTLELQFSLLISIRSNRNCADPDFVHPQVDASRVSRAQRSMKHSAMMRCRPGTVPVRGGPGSAVHRSTSLRAAPRPGHTIASDAFLACPGTRWLVRSLYFPVFLQIRTLPFPVSRSQAHTHTSSFPRRMFAPGVCIVASLTPNRGVGGAPRNVRVRAKHPWGVPSCVKDARERAYDAARQALARRLASHDAGRSPLGAPPWRFWASGPRFRLRHPPSLTLRRAWIRAASSSQPGRSARRATSRASRGERLQAAAAGRHASLRIQDRL